MPDTHIHADFQGGRPHSIERRHRGDPSPHLHEGLKPLIGYGSRSGPKDYKLLNEPERDKARLQYRQALESIPIEKLYGHQLEQRGVCGECRGTLKHPMDGHYHTISNDRSFSDPICCACLLKLRGMQCKESWTKMKDLRKKINDIVEVLPYHYWQCKECDHKWRNKNAKARACNECNSAKVKEIKNANASRRK